MIGLFIRGGSDDRRHSMPLRFPDDPLYQLLRAEKMDEFNELQALIIVT